MAPLKLRFLRLCRFLESSCAGGFAEKLVNDLAIQSARVTFANFEEWLLFVAGKAHE